MKRAIYPAGRAGALTASILASAALAYPTVASSATELDAHLAEIRAATERFQDVEVALAEGYVADRFCVTAEMEGQPAELGAMGIHYFHPELLGVTATEPRVDGTGTHVDFLRPALLLYEPQADGSLELVAVENLVFEAAWLEAGNTEGPVLMGRNWEHMVDDPETEIDEAHGFAPHYDQHVWIYRENPNGPLEPFNPAVTCEHHQE